MKNLSPIHRNINSPNIVLFFSNRFSLSIRATAYGILLPLLIIKTSNLNLSSVFLCCFDISSLYTNVPQAETIRICAEAFYSSEHPPVPFPRQIFVELMEMATSSVEFSFDDIMHCQVDGFAVGSPLRPSLANILLTTMNINFSRPLPNRRCITATWMTLS